MKAKLVDAINQIRQKGDLSGYDESATKQVIILRILNSLGWDTFDREEVFPEYVTSGKRVDYSLRHRNANKVFIEAKRIREGLESHDLQLLTYAFEIGVSLAILTNGLTWWFYLPLVEAEWQQRKFITIDLQNQEIEEIVDRFIDYLSKENVISNKAIENAKGTYHDKRKSVIIKNALPQAFDKIIYEPNEFFVDLLIEKTEEISGHRPEAKIVEQFLKEKKSTTSYTSGITEQRPVVISTSVSTHHENADKEKIFTEENLSLEELLTKDLGYSKPLILHIKGKQIKVSTWRDVSVEFVQWLFNNGHLSNGKIPLFNSAYSDKYFINKEPIHQTPTKDGSWKQVGNIYVDIKYSASNTVKNVIAAIEQLHLGSLKHDIRITVKRKD